MTMESYLASLKGIRIFPGSWRPHYPFEQIAWISPPWPSHDYLWLDFPEAIFTDIGLIYLSHVNPKHPVLFPNLPKVPWKQLSNGLAYRRVLPNGIEFGGKLYTDKPATVNTELYIKNGSEKPLRNIRLQTCLFLRAIKEFSDFTANNKYVHLPDLGWMPFPEAQKTGLKKGIYRLGWRGGPPSADLPVMVTVSNQAERLVAFTWERDTFSLVCNPDHPCMHADPYFPDLDPGDSAVIHGRIIFYEGGLEQFEEEFEIH